MIQDKLEVLEQILKPLRKSQRKTIVLVIEAMASLAQAASIPIAAFLSQATATQVDSALTRFYRLLHNPRLDDLLLARQILASHDPTAGTRQDIGHEVQQLPHPHARLGGCHRDW